MLCFDRVCVAMSSLWVIIWNNCDIKQNRDLSGILRNKDLFLVRKFLNEIFPKEMIVESNEEKINLKEEIANFCNENLPNIIEYLIVTKNANLNKKNEFLLLASEQGHKEIVLLLIEKRIDILNARLHLVDI